MFQEVTAVLEVGSVGPYHSNVHLGERARGHILSGCVRQQRHKESFFFFFEPAEIGLGQCPSIRYRCR